MQPQKQIWTNPTKCKNPICGRHQIGLSLFLSPYHPRPHPLWWACRPGMHQPPPNTFSRRIANPRLSSSGPLFACPSSGLHLEFCKRSEAINSSCACHVVHFIKTSMSFDILQKCLNLSTSRRRRGGSLCNCLSRGLATFLMHSYSIMNTYRVFESNRD